MPSWQLSAQNRKTRFPGYFIFNVLQTSNMAHIPVPRETRFNQRFPRRAGNSSHLTPSCHPLFERERQLTGQADPRGWSPTIATLAIAGSLAEGFALVVMGFGLYPQVVPDVSGSASEAWLAQLGTVAHRGDYTTKILPFPPRAVESLLCNRRHQDATTSAPKHFPLLAGALVCLKPPAPSPPLPASNDRSVSSTRIGWPSTLICFSPIGLSFR